MFLTAGKLDDGLATGPRRTLLSIDLVYSAWFSQVEQCPQHRLEKFE